MLLPRAFHLGPVHAIDPATAQSWFARMAGEAVEVAAFAYLDPQWRLLGMRYTRSTSRMAVEVPVRAVATDVLALDCRIVLMAHNHPSGDPRPSEGDRIVTKRLARGLDALGAGLIDHLILAGAQVTSFRALGLL